MLGLNGFGGAQIGSKLEYVQKSSAMHDGRSAIAFSGLYSASLEINCSNTVRTHIGQLKTTQRILCLRHIRLETFSVLLYAGYVCLCLYTH